MDPGYNIKSERLKSLLSEQDAVIGLEFIQPMTHGTIQNLLKNKRKHWRKVLVLKSLHVGNIGLGSVGMILGSINRLPDLNTILP